MKMGMDQNYGDGRGFKNLACFGASVSLLQKRAQRRGRKPQLAAAQWVAAIFVWQNMYTLNNIRIMLNIIAVKHIMHGIYICCVYTNYKRLWLPFNQKTLEVISIGILLNQGE